MLTPEQAAEQGIEFVDPTVIIDNPLDTGPEMVAGPGIILNLPDDIILESDNRNGARVTWIATAEDELGNPIDVICDPKNKAIFPIGDTTVTCWATIPGIMNEDTGQMSEPIISEGMFNVNVWTEAKGNVVTDLIPKLPPVP